MEWLVEQMEVIGWLACFIGFALLASGLMASRREPQVRNAKVGLLFFAVGCALQIIDELI